MLEFVNSGLYFVEKDEKDFTNLLLQVRSGSNEKSTGSADPHPYLQ